MEFSRSPGKRDIPPWAGSGPLSTFVNGLLSVRPILRLLHLFGRRVVLTSVLKNEEVKRFVNEFQDSFTAEEREKALARITNPSFAYPSYFLNSFHGYVAGNMSWEAALEAYPATLAVSQRAIGKHLTFKEAFEKIRAAHLDVVFANAPTSFGAAENFTALDVGCGVALSSLKIQERLRRIREPSRDRSFKIIGVDASPYMLAVAERYVEDDVFSFRHALAEDTQLPDNSVDWVSMQFLIHELPSNIARKAFSEAYRILKHGGVLSMIDNDPTSPVLHRLPAPVFMMMKSTEPYLDQYYSADIIQDVRNCGFENVTSTRTSPRYRTVVATKK